MKVNMDVLDFNSLSDAEVDAYTKKGYAIELYMDMNDKTSITIEELLKTEIVGNNFKDVAASILFLLKNNPDKYDYSPVLKSELQEKYSNSDEYLLDGGSVFNIDMVLSVK